ncbi:uncharacterized protein LOC144345464 [Saccoglossus kowalevskii]
MGVTRKSSIISKQHFSEQNTCDLGLSLKPSQVKETSIVELICTAPGTTDVLIAYGENPIKTYTYQLSSHTCCPVPGGDIGGGGLSAGSVLLIIASVLVVVIIFDWWSFSQQILQT